MEAFEIKKWFKENKKNISIWSVLVLFSLFFTILQKRNTDPPQSIQNLDTYIPKGFVLVPVELSNGSQLEGLLKHKGVVDLYVGDHSQQRAKPAAKSVKIIRSPQNPEYFAVLIPENQASLLIERFQAFHAVIQNPKVKRKTRIRGLNRKRSRIVIEPDH